MFMLSIYFSVNKCVFVFVEANLCRFLIACLCLYWRWRSSYIEGHAGIQLTPSHFCACPKPRYGFPTVYAVVLFFLRSLIWVQIQFLYFFLKMQVIWYKEPISQLLTYTIGLFFVNRYVSRGAVITVINCVIIILLIQLFLLSQDGNHRIWKWDSLITISECEYYYFFFFYYLVNKHRCNNRWKSVFEDLLGSIINGHRKPYVYNIH